MFWRLWSLIVKEFQAVWRDKKGRYVLIVPPIIQTLLFSYAATMEVKDVAVAICNRDAGYYGRELCERVRASSAFHRVLFLENQEQAQPVVDSRRVLAALVIPQDFSARLLSGRPAQLQAILDGRKSNSAQIAAGYLNEICLRLEQDTIRNNVAKHTVSATSNADAVTPGTAGIPTVEIVTRAWFNANKDYQWFTVPGLIGIIMALEVMLLTGLSVARERELGTFEQLQVSPLTPYEIILGKTVPAVLIGLAEGTLIVLMAMFLFDVPLRGAVPLLYLGMFVFALAMTGVGLFVSAIVQTQQQALLGTFMVLMPSVLLSGFMTPVENMPPWLQTATAWNPLRYFLIIVKGIFLKDMPLSTMLHSVVPMLCIAAVTLSVSVWSFRRRLG